MPQYAQFSPNTVVATVNAPAPVPLTATNSTTLQVDTVIYPVQTGSWLALTINNSASAASSGTQLFAYTIFDKNGIAIIQNSTGGSVYVQDGQQIASAVTAIALESMGQAVLQVKLAAPLTCVDPTTTLVQYVDTFQIPVAYYAGTGYATPFAVEKLQITSVVPSLTVPGQNEYVFVCPADPRPKNPATQVKIVWNRFYDTMLSADYWLATCTGTLADGSTWSSKCTYANAGTNIRGFVPASLEALGLPTMSINGILSWSNNTNRGAFGAKVDLKVATTISGGLVITTNQLQFVPKITIQVIS